MANRDLFVCFHTVRGQNAENPGLVCQCHSGIGTMPCISALPHAWGTDSVCVFSDTMMLARTGGRGKGKVKGTCQLSLALTQGTSLSVQC